MSINTDMDDGQEALDTAIAAGRFQGRILSLDELGQRGRLSPQDLTGLAIRMHYTDAEGDDSSRWITIQSLTPEMLTAYCWRRRRIRTFRLDRVEGVSDANGEYWPAARFFGGGQDEAPVRASAPIPTPVSRKRAKPKVKSDASNKAKTDRPDLKPYLNGSLGSARSSVRAVETDRSGWTRFLNESSAISLPDDDKARINRMEKYKTWRDIICFCISFSIPAVLFSKYKASEVFYITFFIISLVASLVGLVRPRWILPGVENPKKWQAMLCCLGFAFYMLILAISVGPN